MADTTWLGLLLRKKAKLDKLRAEVCQGRFGHTNPYTAFSKIWADIEGAKGVDVGPARFKFNGSVWPEMRDIPLLKQ